MICILLIAVCGFALLAGASGAVAAQQGNESNQSDESTIIHDFAESDVILTDVRFENDTAFISLESESREVVTVSDAGFESQGQFSVTTVRFEGEKTIELPIRDEEIVAVSTPQDGYQYEGDVGLLTIIQSEPTTVLVQWATIAGTLGPIISLGLVVTSLRRSHENTFKELTSQEKIKVEKDPVDGFVDKVSRLISENWLLVISMLLLMAYTLFWLVGRVPGPIGIWEGMTDAMRVIVIGSLMAVLLSLVPVYVIAKRLWNPNKEFVVSADARDVIEKALGADGGLAEMVESIQDGEGGLVDEDGNERDYGNYGISIYSGSPERINEMEIDGKATDSKAPGGPCHFVQAFDPSKNAARGTWPGVADDLQLIAERSKIDGNREILRDESQMLRSLLSAMPAISISSDTGAARAVDREMRDLLAIDGSPVDGILSRAASGTRFEGFYDDDSEPVEYQHREEQSDEQDDETQKADQDQ